MLGNPWCLEGGQHSFRIFRSCKDKSCLPRKVCPSVPLPKLSLSAAEFNLLQAPACTLSVCSHRTSVARSNSRSTLRWTFFPGSILSKDRFSVLMVCCADTASESVLRTNYMCCLSTVIFGRIPLGSVGPGHVKKCLWCLICLGHAWGRP